MSRSGYHEDDSDNWSFIMWRGRVASSIRGKRGQALLRELEAALVALPEKKLCQSDFANPTTGQVCALGAVALKRRLDKGQDRATAIREIAAEFPEGEEAELVCEEFDIAEPLAKEITYVNDEYLTYEDATPEKRYEEVLAWVRSKIKPAVA